eukprot:TRINITY_DN30475_c0_g1_i1.p1 TRINITY_DN30475_c0_g1~~TRINITY_DN30475_c0_g1_i1.p1  ORF type:complete len:737 (+),score=218.27 TRINITY_DN30475_c0_g1_i1:1-2211(+)
MSGSDVVQWLLGVAAGAAGPHGRGVAMLSGIVNVSAASDEALRMVVEWMHMPRGVGETDVAARRLVLSQHPFTKLLQQTVSAHVKRCGGGGWHFLYMAAAMASWGYTVEETVPPSVMQYTFDVLRDWTVEFFEDQAVGGRRCRAAAGRPMAALLATELAANAVLALTPSEAAALASQVVRSVLTVVDPATHKANLECIRYLPVVSEAADPTASELLDGLVIDWGYPLEVALCYGDDAALPLPPEGGYKVCLFSCCVEPEVTYSAAAAGGGGEVTLVEGEGVEGEFERAAWSRLFAIFERLVSLGVRVVASQKTLHVRLRLWLASRKVVVLERLSIRHIDAFRTATGAVMHNAPSLGMPETSFGAATVLEEVTFETAHSRGAAAKRYIRVSGPGRPVVTHVLRHSHLHFLTELEVQVKRAQRMVASALRDPRVVPGGGVTDLALSEYIAARASVAEHATTGAVAKLAPHLAADVARVAQQYAAALRGWAGVVAAGAPPGAHGAPPHTAAPVLDSIARANVDARRLRDAVACAMGVPPLEAQRAWLLPGPRAVPLRVPVSDPKPGALQDGGIVAEARGSEGEGESKQQLREGLRRTHRAVMASRRTAAAPTWVAVAPRLHCCAAPPGCRYEGGRTVVPGAAPVPPRAGADAPWLALHHRGMRVGGEWVDADADDDDDGADGLEELCRFGDAGELLIPEDEGAPLPLVDSTASKAHGLCTALDVAALLLRTDSLVLDMN